MIHSHRTAFTLIELLVVVAIILILITVSVAVVSDMWRIGDQVKCANNLRQIGQWLINESMQSRAYPKGGSTPGTWADAYSLLVNHLKTPDLTQCPASEDTSPNKPTVWSTCSYAYVAYLTPNSSYTCKCSSCGDDPGKQIWKLYWSGVDYSGGHQKADEHRFKDFALSNNVIFNEDSVDETEPNSPTIPVHQDTVAFHSKDRVKDRTQRALRQVPETPEDHRARMPLMMDIVVLTQRPSGSWEDAHLRITEASQYDILYANHCNTSATKKKDWGINVLYTDQSVQWKKWADLRFQVLAKGINVGGDSEDHYYYY